jgi:hypothetical protein
MEGATLAPIVDEREAMTRQEKIVAIGIVFRIRIALISCLLGALVVLPFIVVYHWDARVVLARILAIALFNGIVGPFYLAHVLYRNIRSNAFWPLLTVFVYVAVVTCGSAFFFGSPGPLVLARVLAWAEIVTLSAAHLIARYTIRLNKKLLQTQERIRNSRSR